MSSTTDPTPPSVAADHATAWVAGAFGRASSSFGRVSPYFETFAGLLVDVAAPVAGERVLDVACGTGLCAAAAAERVGAHGHVLGVDVAPEMVGQASQRLRASASTCAEARVMDAGRLELPDAAFDVVLCGFAVFFFSRPEAALSEMLRVLAPGGRLAVSTVLGSHGFPWTMELRKDFGADGAGRPESSLNDPAHLDAAIAAAGFVAPAAVEVEERFVFADAGAVEQCFWLLRSLSESLAAEDRVRFRAALGRRLAGHAVAGGFELVQRARMTTAQRPARSVR